MPETVLLKNQPLTGEYVVPGDKSISHRALILPVACQQNVSIKGLNAGDDVMATRRALATIGVRFKNESDGSVQLTSPKSFECPPNTIIDMGNSGTSARLLLGLFVSIPHLSLTMTGDESLTKRPMRRVTEPLCLMGASITLKDDKTLPAVIVADHYKPLKGITYSMPVASAQVKSALLIAGLRASSTTTIIEPFLSRDHTENMLRLFGIDVVSDDKTIILTPPDRSKGQLCNDVIEMHVPGDPSAAAFWCVAALCCRESHIIVKGVNGNPLRTEFVSVLRQMGGDVAVDIVGSAVGEPLWDLTVQTSDLKGVKTVQKQSPALMDEFPILAVAAALAEGETVFEGIAELRVKESDRLYKIAELIQLFGGKVEAGADYLRIYGKTVCATDNVIYYDPAFDHRMAMSALVLARALRQSIQVKNTECISTSFPSFLDDFYRIECR